MFNEFDNQHHTLISLQVTSNDCGIRIDRFLAERVAHLGSRVKIQRMIDNGHVDGDGCKITVNDTVVPCSYKVKTNDNILVSVPLQNLAQNHVAHEKQYEKYTSTKANEDVTVIDTQHYDSIKIIYEDEYLLVVDKPAGLVTHPGVGNKRGTLADMLYEKYCGKLSCTYGGERPGIIHRLDKGTSGLLVVAKTDEAHNELSNQISMRTMGRIYIAIVYGVPESKIGTINANVKKSKHDHTKMTVTQHDDGKYAVTHYRVLKNYINTFSLIECKLETGRTHQIRVHMAYKRHPILGDQVYGARYNFNPLALNNKTIYAINNLQRQALHARAIEFAHPITKKNMKFESNPPQDIMNVIESLDELSNGAAH